jgi:hypothetical protein
MKKGDKATKSYKGSICNLVVNLRCECCKQLFPWYPRWKKDIEKRLPATCSRRCNARLRDWERGREERQDKS